jgi:FkbM family methyltransferase
MIRYLREYLKRKAARRKFQTYSHTITDYNFPGVGDFQYANWDNPLSMGKIITNEQYQFYTQFIREGDLAVDIGANIGDTTVPMSLSAGNKGLVLGFECNPVIYSILEINEQLNPEKPNIKAVPYAISETEEEFFYNSSEGSMSNGGISREAKNNHGKFGLSEKVKSVNLVKFLEKEYPEWISKLSFIKTDTEGHDLIILKSIESLIRETRPVIVAECFKRASREEREEIYRMFGQLDYQIYHADKYEGGMQNIPLNIDDFFNMEHFDFLALPVSASS